MEFVQDIFEWARPHLRPINSEIIFFWFMLKEKDLMMLTSQSLKSWHRVQICNSTLTEISHFTSLLSHSSWQVLQCCYKTQIAHSLLKHLQVWPLSTVYVRWALRESQEFCCAERQSHVALGRVMQWVDLLFKMSDSTFLVQTSKLIFSTAP